MRYLSIPIALLALAGCSDPKSASEKNFKVAVQSYLDSEYPHCYVTRNFPAVKADFDFRHENETLEALTKAGLLSRKEIQQEEKDMFGQRPHTVTRLSYDLTAEGKKYYKPGITKNLRGDAVGGFCVGKAEVKSIGQFSEPADMMGLKVSRVNYEYTVSDLPEWTALPEIQQFVDQIQADSKSQTTPIKKVDAVVLTNNGWVHEKLFSQR